MELTPLHQQRSWSLHHYTSNGHDAYKVTSWSLQTNIIKVHGACTITLSKVIAKNIGDHGPSLTWVVLVCDDLDDLVFLFEVIGLCVVPVSYPHSKHLLRLVPRQASRGDKRLSFCNQLGTILSQHIINVNLLLFSPPPHPISKFVGVHFDNRGYVPRQIVS